MNAKLTKRLSLFFALQLHQNFKKWALQHDCLNIFAKMLLKMVLISLRLIRIKNLGKMGLGELLHYIKIASLVYTQKKMEK